MKRLFPLFAGLLALSLSSGCHFFHKKKDAPAKQSPKVATEVETEFQQRWVDKRTADLTATGVNADAAHAQAIAEFNQKYSAMSVAK